MKNKSLITILFALALVSPATMQKIAAQNTVAEIVSKFSKISIVREYSENQFLVYNYTGQGNSSFNLIDIAANSCISYPVGDLEVNDMEVVNEMAYFCGGWNGKVVAGWFNIPAVFYGGGSIIYFAVPSPFTCQIPSVSATETVLSLDRLDVIDYGSNYNHLVMIGSAYCTHAATPTQCIVEVYYDGNDWITVCQVEHSDVFHYDDISVMATDVVVVGHKKNTNGEYITFFNTPAINSHIFFPGPTTPYLTYSSGFPAYSPHYHSEVLIDDIPGTSKFATVCQAEYCTSPYNCFEGTFLNLYLGASTVIYRCRIDDYHSLTYKELKYNENKNSFLLLMEDCNTNMHNGYYEFELDNTQSYVTNVSFHQDLNYNYYHSVDKYTQEHPLKQCVMTGVNSSDDLVIWVHDLSLEMNCSKTTPISFVSVPTDSYYFYYEYPCSDRKIILKTYTAATEIEEINIICSE